MAASAPNDTTPHQPDPRPTGDLEYLFQQKFAEAEVTPRASFWEQLDHELVVQQHEQVVQENTAFRRRLVLHRWVAAACLLLALGFGSWAYLGPDILSNSGELAANTTSGSGQQATASSTGALDGNQSLPANEVQPSAESLNTQAATGLLASASSTVDEQTALGTGYTAVASTNASHGVNTYGIPAGQETSVEYSSVGGYYTSGRYAPGTTGIQLTTASSNAAGTDDYSFSGAGLLTPRAAYLRNLLGSGRPDTLKPALLAVPRSATSEVLAAATPEEQKEAPKLWKRLRLGGGYAAGTFNPNINFSRTDGRVKADPVSNALRSYYQEEAEDEYRRNLRSGLSQRAALTASYALNKHWTLTAAAEVAELRATSATTYGFIDGKQVGPQAADIFSRPAAYSPAPPQPRTTAYRYRTASVPVGVQYGSAKAGVSLYAKVGAAVSVLLSSRSELEGSPAATRNYTFKSTDSPYRQVLVSGRGGAGVRYQPASAGWRLSVGPTAETYFTTLNANPNQRAINQSRPYSVGLEASVEFGAPKLMPGVQ